MPRPDDIRFVHRGDHCAVGVFENVLIVVWFRETPPEVVRKIAGALSELARERPEPGVGFIQVVDKDCPALSGEARDALSDLLKASAGVITCSTVVFEGEGFRAAAIRGIATGLALLSRATFPHQVFAAVSAAVEWQLAHLKQHNGQLNSVVLTHAVEQLHSAARLRSNSVA